MARGNEEDILPEVTDDDIEVVQFEDLTDSNHYTRWIEFAESNPVLAQALLSRARERMSSVETDVERIKVAIDIATYAVRSIEVAMERTLSDGAGGGEDRPPST